MNKVLVDQLVPIGTMEKLYDSDSLIIDEMTNIIIELYTLKDQVPPLTFMMMKDLIDEDQKREKIMYKMIT